MIKGIAAASRREHEERRPKNAGIHADQLKRVATRTNRRKAKQELRNHHGHE